MTEAHETDAPFPGGRTVPVGAVTLKVEAARALDERGEALTEWAAPGELAPVTRAGVMWMVEYRVSDGSTLTIDARSQALTPPEEIVLPELVEYERLAGRE